MNEVTAPGPSPATSRRRRVLQACGLVVGVCAAAALFVVWPLPAGLLDLEPVASARVLDRDGGLLREALTSTEVRGAPLSGPIPPHVEQAFLAAEDRRFYDHGGVDVRAIARAIVDAARAGALRGGASTLTQQLARRLVKRAPGLFGKLQEALWALRLEFHLDKATILRAYLDRVPLGQGSVGVGAAAVRTYGVEPAQLSVAQAALLAGIAHAPEREHPRRDPAAALKRRAVILERMARLGFLDEPALRSARAEPLDLAEVPPAPRLAPHLSAHLLASRAARGLEDAVTLQTTLDPTLQREVEEIVRAEVGQLQQQKGLEQAAVLVVDNDSGDVLAWVGSADFWDAARQGQNDGVRALRQPGSALKPFAYGLALSQGMSPSTILPDVAASFAIEQGLYAPQNYDKRTHGPVRLRTALQSSYNVPAVHAAEHITAGGLLQVLRDAGFSSLKEDVETYGVGLVLGNGEVSVYEMARAYRGIRDGGVRKPLRVLRSATDAAGNPLPIPVDVEPKRFLSKDTAALLTHILMDDAERAPAFGLDHALRLPFPVAAKTGTSRAWVDNWTAGFTRERTVVVWAGAFDGKAMEHVSGITGAGVIFHRAMVAAMRGIDPAPLVDDATVARFQRVAVCPLSGQRAQAGCPGHAVEVFLPGKAPATSCTAHPAHGASGPDPAAAGCVALEGVYQAWGRSEGLRACAASTTGPPRLLAPRPGDTFLLEPGLPPEASQVPVRASGGAGLAVQVDGGAALPLSAEGRAWVPVTRGRRALALVDRAGHVVETVAIDVR